MFVVSIFIRDLKSSSGTLAKITFLLNLLMPVPARHLKFIVTNLLVYPYMEALGFPFIAEETPRKSQELAQAATLLSGGRAGASNLGPTPKLQNSSPFLVLMSIHRAPSVSGL